MPGVFKVIMRMFSHRNLLDFYLENSQTLFKGYSQSYVLSLWSIIVYTYSICFLFIDEAFLLHFNENSNHSRSALSNLSSAYTRTIASYPLTLVICVAINALTILLSIILYIQYSYAPFKNAICLPLSAVLQNYFTLFYMPLAYYSLNNHSTLGYFNLACTLFIALGTSRMGGKFQFIVRDHLAKRQNGLQSISICLIFMGLLLRDITTERFVHILAAASSLLIAVEIYMVMPFYDKRIERSFFTLNCVSILWNIFLFIAANIEQLEGIAIVLICLPIITAKFAMNIYAKRTEYIDQALIGRQINNLKFKQSIKPWMLEHHVRSISIINGEFKLRTYMESSNQSFIEDIALQHIEACSLRPHCFCENIIIERAPDGGGREFLLDDHLRLQFHHNYVVNLYEKYMEQNKKFDEVYIAYLLYLLEAMQNKCLAFSKCAQFLSIAASTSKSAATTASSSQFELSFEYIAILSNMQNRMTRYAGENAINAVIAFDEQLFRLHESITSSVRVKNNFLAEISNDHIDLNTVQKIGTTFLKLRETVEANFTSLYKKCRTNYFLQLLVQIYLLALSFSDSKLWFEQNKIGGMSAVSLKKQSSQYNQNSEYLEKIVLYSKKSVAMFASLQKEKFAKLQKVSKNIEPVLGYVKEEVLGANVAVFVTSNLAECHNNLIWRFLKRGHLIPSLISRMSPLIAKKKSGFLVPISMKLQVGYVGKEDIGVSSLITASSKKAASSEHFLAIDMKSKGFALRIDGFTEGIFHRLLQPACNFSRIEDYYSIRGNRLFPLLPFYLAATAASMQHSANLNKQRNNNSYGSSSTGFQKTETIEMLGFIPLNSRRLLIKSSQQQLNSAALKQQQQMYQSHYSQKIQNNNNYQHSSTGSKNQAKTIEEYRNVLLAALEKGRLSATSNVLVHFSLTISQLHEDKLEYCHIQINAFTEVNGAENSSKLLAFQIQSEFEHFAGIQFSPDQIEDYFNVSELLTNKRLLATTSNHPNFESQRTYKGSKMFQSHRLFATSGASAAAAASSSTNAGFFYQSMYNNNNAAAAAAAGAATDFPMSLNRFMHAANASASQGGGGIFNAAGTTIPTINPALPSLNRSTDPDGFMGQSTHGFVGNFMDFSSHKENSASDYMSFQPFMKQSENAKRRVKLPLLHHTQSITQSQTLAQNNQPSYQQQSRKKSSSVTNSMFASSTNKMSVSTAGGLGFGGTGDINNNNNNTLINSNIQEVDNDDDDVNNVQAKNLKQQSVVANKNKRRVKLSQDNSFVDFSSDALEVVNLQVASGSDVAGAMIGQAVLKPVRSATPSPPAAVSGNLPNIDYGYVHTNNTSPAKTNANNNFDNQTQNQFIDRDIFEQKSHAIQLREPSSATDLNSNTELILLTSQQFHHSNANLFQQHQNSAAMMQGMISPTQILSPAASASASMSILSPNASDDKRGLLFRSSLAQQQQNILQSAAGIGAGEDFSKNMTESNYFPSIKTNTLVMTEKARRKTAATMGTAGATNKDKGASQYYNKSNANNNRGNVSSLSHDPFNQSEDNDNNWNDDDDEDRSNSQGLNLSQEMQSLKDLSLSATSKGSYDKTLKKAVLNSIESAVYPLAFLVMKLISFASLGVIVIVIVTMYLNLQSDFSKQILDFYYIPWGMKMRVTVSRMVKDKSMSLLTDYPLLSGQLADIASVKSEVASNMVSLTNFYLENLRQIVLEPRNDLVLKSHLYSSYAPMTMYLWSGNNVQLNPTLLQAMQLNAELLYIYAHIVKDEKNIIYNMIGLNFGNFTGYLSKSQTIQEESVSAGFDTIETRMNVLLAVIAGICGCFVITTLLAFAYSQKNKERILKLFASIEPHKIIEMHAALALSLDILFSNKTKNLLSVGGHSNLIKQRTDRLVYVPKKKKLTSPTNSLPIWNIRLIISSFFVLAILLIYPIVNLVTTLNLISQSNSNQSLTGTLQTLKAQIASNLASYSTTMASKMNGSSTYDFNKARFATVIGTNAGIMSSFQANITSQEHVSRYDSSTYDAFFFASMKDNACDAFDKYFNVYNTQSERSFSKSNCESYFSGQLRNGILSTIQRLMSVFADLSEINKITDETQWNAQLSAYFDRLNYFEINRMLEMILLMIETFTSFINTTNREFFELMIGIQTWLMIYQFVVLAFTYKFALLEFVAAIEVQLLSTKRILSVFEAKYLYENSYILSYLKG